MSTDPDVPPPPESPAPMPDEATLAAATARLRLETQARNGAGWFHWIAGLSIFNAVALLLQWNFAFVGALGVTWVFAILAQHFGESAGAGQALVTVLILGITLFGAAVFISLGALARRGHLWAFIVGLILYALDGVLMVLLGRWLEVAFHAFILFGIHGGYRAARAFEAIRVAQEPAALAEDQP